jgi:hypothetical protein
MKKKKKTKEGVVEPSAIPKGQREKIKYFFEFFFLIFRCLLRSKILVKPKLFSVDQKNLI